MLLATATAARGVFYINISLMREKIGMRTGIGKNKD